MSLFSTEATQHSICTTRQTSSTPGHFELNLSGANFNSQVWLSFFCHILKTNSKSVPSEMPQQFPQPSVRFHSIKLDWSVCTYLTQVYDGRDMYRIYNIKNNYMFWHLTLAIIRLRNERTY